jgi:hypothetical protein
MAMTDIDLSMSARIGSEILPSSLKLMENISN